MKAMSYAYMPRKDSHIMHLKQSGTAMPPSSLKSIESPVSMHLHPTATCLGCLHAMLKGYEALLNAIADVTSQCYLIKPRRDKDMKNHNVDRSTESKEPSMFQPGTDAKMPRVVCKGLSSRAPAIQPDVKATTMITVACHWETC
jgi:hypothetical protein